MGCFSLCFTILGQLVGRGNAIRGVHHIPQNAGGHFSNEGTKSNSWRSWEDLSRKQDGVNDKTIDLFQIVLGKLISKVESSSYFIRFVVNRDS